ncbi:MAG: hypothetical protein OHK0021_00960 [Bryobacter sp.]
MQDRRENPRMMCADLVKVEWRDRDGLAQSTVANLEDISASGACLQLEEDVPPQTVVHISYDEGTFSGKVRYCIFRDIGYFLGIEFEPGHRWDAGKFRPLHMLDPRRLQQPAEEKEPSPVVSA